MKKTILTLIIGILIGAIIATAVFLIIDKNESNNNFPEGMEMMQDGERPSMPNGEDGEFNPGQRGDFKPDDNTTENSSDSTNNV